MSTPLWGSHSTPSGGLGSSGGAFSDPWASSSAKPSTAPPGGYGSGGGTTQDALPPGSVSVNPLDPIGSAQTFQSETDKLFGGLKNALFGTSAPDRAGQHGGIVGDIPVLGDLTRFGAEAIGAIPKAVMATPGFLADTIGGTLEHIDLSSEAEKGRLQVAYAAIPADSPAKIAAEAELKGNGSIVGPATSHILSKAVRAHQEELNTTNPSLFAGMLSETGSVADTVTNLFGVLGAAQRGTERLIAGAAKSNGMNQLQWLDMLDKGKGSLVPTGILGQTKGLLGSGVGPDLFTGGSAELQPAEQIALDKWRLGKEGRQDGWTETQALDFLASHGAGLSHDVGLEIAGSFATDPQNVLSMGATALARAGALGVRLASSVSKAEEAVAAADKVLEAANATGSALDVSYATRALGVAEGKLAETATLAMRQAGKSTYRRVNVLGRAAESRQTTELVRFITKPYVGMQGNAFGKAAKVVRTIIDPLHAMDLKLPGGSRNVDLLSDVATKAVVAPHGFVTHQELQFALNAISPQVLADFDEGLAVYASNVTRHVVAVKHRASIMMQGLWDQVESLASGAKESLPSVVVPEILAQQKNGILRSISEEANRFRLRGWDQPALQNLADRLASAYKVRSPEEWLAEITTGSLRGNDQRALLHAATYGTYQKQLLDAVGKATTATTGINSKLHKIILLNRNTLTYQGGEGIIADIEAATSSADALKVIEAAQAKYLNLRYISIDYTNPIRSVKTFTDYLSSRLRHLPMQVVDSEIATMDQGLKDLHAAMRGEFSFGMAPDDEFKWGIKRGSDGLYAPIGDVWVDHVADGALAYRAGRSISTNILGQAIIDIPVLRAISKPIDYIEAMGRVVTNQVSGAMISDAAHAKFLVSATARFPKGVTQSNAEEIWKGLQDLTASQDTIVNPRGFSSTSLWNAVETLIPMSARRVGFDKRALLSLVLDAYDGDVRFLGVTQKLTARMKVVLGKTGSNFAGEIAEHAWPLMKFRLNAIFQAQEKIEGWVLNAQRGVVGSVFGTTMSDADIKTEALLQRMVNYSLVRMGDMDQGEYAAPMLHGKDIMATASNTGSALGKMRAAADSLMEVKGVKRINMLRTFRAGLGKELKAVWEARNPGEWDQMLQDAQRRAGALMTDDDFAVQMIADKMLGNDVLVKRLTDAGGTFTGLKAEFRAAIQPGMWAMPQNLGELQPLNLDEMARFLGFPIGQGAHATTQQELRAAIAGGKIKLEDVLKGLREYGADPDYVRRVENALNFSWDGFWQRAKEAYNLTDEQSRNLQNFIAGSARARDMTPLDYMSQIFAPNITSGMDGAVGALGSAVDMMRGGEQVPVSQLAKLTAKAGADSKSVSTYEDLVRQMSAVFSVHLDPSAKRALLLQFRPELDAAVTRGVVRLDAKELEEMWNADAENQLADRILGYINGRPGTGIHTVVTDASVGNEALRTSAADYLNAQGRNAMPPGRRAYEPDHALGGEVATAYEDMPPTVFVPLNETLTTKSLKLSGVSSVDDQLKNAAYDTRADQRVTAAYKTFVAETNAQFTHLSKTVRVTVVKTPEPYADAAALQADLAKGKLKVYGGDNAHPYLMSEQVVRYRAVHMAYGYGAEGFTTGAAGALNAAAVHGVMYSDEARAAMLTEALGAKSWEHYSTEVIPSAPKIPDTIAEYRALAPKPTKVRHVFTDDLSMEEWRRANPQILADQKVWLAANPGKPLPANLRPPKFKNIPYELHDQVGPGVEALTPEEQTNLVRLFHEIRTQFPDINIVGFDVRPLGATGANSLRQGVGVHGLTMHDPWTAVGDKGEDIVVILNDQYFGAGAADYARENLRRHETGQQLSAFDFGRGVQPRETFPGVPANLGIGMRDTVFHEWAHVIQDNMQSRFLNTPAEAEFMDMVNRYARSTGRKWVSEYSIVGGDGVTEAWAELFNLAVNPDQMPLLDELQRAAAGGYLGQALYPGASRQVLLSHADEIQHAEEAAIQLLQDVDEARQVLIDNGIWKPMGPEVSSTAGQTVGAVNAVTPGTIKATPKVGLLPQELLDRFHDQFIGVGKYAESNPDVARVAQMFGKWSGTAVKQGMYRDGSAGTAIEDILGQLAKMPMEDAAPYNKTEALLMQAATASMEEKWRDAYRLQYFAQSRSMLERSINHPMFGIYPASYMWGKILPEMVHFIASAPFGLRTGGMAYTMLDVQKAVAIQREYDPEFDKMIEKIGHNQFLSFLGYMLPSLPWDVQSSFPTWARDLAAAGNNNAAAVATGGLNKPIDLIKPGVDTVKKLSPYQTSIPWVGRAISEVTGAGKPVKPTYAPATTPDGGAVQGVDLGPTLEETMQELRAALQGG